MALTDKDLDNIGNLIETTFDEKEILTIFDISHLPSKDEFYTKMDEVIGELKAIREENVMSSGRLSDHEDRIIKLENKLAS